MPSTRSIRILAVFILKFLISSTVAVANGTESSGFPGILNVTVLNNTHLTCVSSEAIRWSVYPSPVTPQVCRDALEMDTVVRRWNGSLQFNLGIRLMEDFPPNCINRYSVQCHSINSTERSSCWHKLTHGFESQNTSIIIPGRNCTADCLTKLCHAMNNTARSIVDVNNLNFCKYWAHCELFSGNKSCKVSTAQTSGCPTDSMNCFSYKSMNTRIHKQSGIKYGVVHIELTCPAQHECTNTSYMVPYAGKPQISVVRNSDQNKTDSLVLFHDKREPPPIYLNFTCLAPSLLYACGMRWFLNGVEINSVSTQRSEEEYPLCKRKQHYLTFTMAFRTSEAIVNNSAQVACAAFNEYTGMWDMVTLAVKYENKSTSDKISFVATIVGATVGGCLLVILPLLVFLLHKLHRQAQRLQLTREEIYDFMDGMQRERAQGKHAYLLLPYDKELEIPEADIKIMNTVLGSGAFGKVVMGIYQGRSVALKTVTNSSDPTYFRSLLHELKVMSYLGKHEFLLELVGALTGQIRFGKVFLVLELCSNGNAKNYIREHREEFVNMLSTDLSCYTRQFKPSHLDPAMRPARSTMRLKADPLNFRYHDAQICPRVGDNGADQLPRNHYTLSSRELVRWSYEVAAGMEFVASKMIYHGDLAARNILLTDSLQAKISDFGLSRELGSEKYSVYVQKKECPLPLRWMAIESLRDLTFSIQSDVWSFGITLWELFSLGEIPYPGMDWNFESWKMLVDGCRMDRPLYASIPINNIIQSCWQAEPSKRPSFVTLRKLLFDLLGSMSENDVTTSEFLVDKNK